MVITTYLLRSSGNNNQNIIEEIIKYLLLQKSLISNVGTGLADGNTEYLDIDGDGELRLFNYWKKRR